jgi:hypothetical protein
MSYNKNFKEICLTQWEEWESKYYEVLEKKGGEDLIILEDKKTDIEKKISNSCDFITKDDLMAIVNWKFKKGKPRFSLMKYLKNNQELEIEEKSKMAFSKASNGDIKGAIETLSELKGVGPATSSAVLSIYKPELFCFMDDELIEMFSPRKREYSLKTYLLVNRRCKEIAEEIGNGWTCYRIGRALWVSSKLGDIQKTDRKTTEPVKKRVRKC